MLLQATLTEGQSFRYDVDAGLEVKAAKGTETVDQKLRLRFTVGHAGKEGTVVRCRVESAKVHAVRPGAEAVDAEWKEGEGAGPDDEPVVPRLYRRLGAAKIELDLDEHGAVRSVSGLEGIAEDGAQARALGVLAADSAPRMLQGVFTLDPDGKAHRTGEHWTWTQGFPAGVWMASSSTEYALQELAGAVAKVHGVTTITAREPKGDEGASPRLQITAQSITTDAEWDTARARLVKRTTESQVELRSTLPLKEPIVATSTSRSRVVVTRVEGVEGAGEAPKK